MDSGLRESDEDGKGSGGRGEGAEGHTETKEHRFLWAPRCLGVCFLQQGFWAQFQHVCVCLRVCVWGGSPHQQVILGPQQRLRIHLNSDTIYLDIESDSIRERLGLTRPPATTDASVETQVVTCAPDSLVLS